MACMGRKDEATEVPIRTATAMERSPRPGRLITNWELSLAVFVQSRDSDGAGKADKAAQLHVLADRA